MARLWVLRDTNEDDAFIYYTESVLPDLFDRPTLWTEEIDEARAFTDEQKEDMELPRGRYGLDPVWIELPRPEGLDD